MKKIIFFHIIIFLMVEFTGCTKTSTEKKTETVAPIQKHNDLPSMTLMALDGTQINTLSIKGKSILILFQPDCDHCQREAKEIRENLEAFKEYSIYFISADPMPAIEKFAKDYELVNRANIFFGMTTVDNVLKNFGPIPAPSVYIYSDQVLKQKFNGEVAIDKILQAL
jgi:peroxiredoxin